MLAKKLVTAQKRGETRALCLGLGMVACSMVMYFFIGITIVPLYTNSVWTTKTNCNVLKTNIKEKVDCSCCEGANDNYPCLEVWVNLNFSGQEVMLYHTEDTRRRNPKCSYIPPKLENATKVKQLIETVAENFRKYQTKTFLCYWDPEGKQTNVILRRLYQPKDLYFPFIWPSLMLIGGILIIVTVKVNQYMSAFSAWKYKTNI
ncbi:PREDICTED: calcium-activated potassium channel subunit beta-1 [Crocodylus porosus]|uniref:Potassium calcium-activated channel subfamily M regulatory beta subunit 1 n=1 Tax=Crocodylus porosus TaxID=8502 RepID=A0A7M4E4Z4_CROPO|nr:PREDICTED: calcium-activated potassium channel subunit beta-1 [Crocodylus porosus]